MGRMRKQQKKAPAPVATNSVEHLAKWDALFKVVRGRIERVLESGQDLNPDLRALVIERFRGCISALSLFQFNQPILLEKSKDLLAVVGDICAYGRSNVGTTPPSLIELLEVFIKEALVHPTLRHLLDPSRQQLLEVSGVPLIQELMLGHLHLSFPKQICLNFTDSFCRSLAISNASNDGGASLLGMGLGLDSTLALLSTSSSSRMPYLLQAHAAIIASRCIEARNPFQGVGLWFDRAISSFELSGKLYWRSLCDLDLGQRLRPYLSRGAKKPLLKQVQSCHIDEMALLFHSTGSQEVAQKDLFSQISCYIDETQRAVHENLRLQTGDTLKRIVSVLLTDKELGKKRIGSCEISQELVTLAAFARLMASSLFRAVAEAREMNGRAQRSGRREKYLELEGRLMGSLDWDSDAGCRLAGRKADQVVSRVLLDEISMGSARCKTSVLMLQHFSKLMLVGLRARADFLWKACVLVLSAILNLMAFEGEEFDALRMLAGNAHEPMETAKGLTQKRKMKAKQLSVLPNAKRLCTADDDLVNCEGSCQSKNDMCDSSVFLEKRIPEVRADLSEKEDLVVFFERPPEDLKDFFECSPDMDLPCWLREREGLFKKNQAAQKRKRKMLRKLLGTSI